MSLIKFRSKEWDLSDYSKNLEYLEGLNLSNLDLTLFTLNYLVNQSGFVNKWDWDGESKTGSGVISIGSGMISKDPEPNVSAFNYVNPMLAGGCHYMCIMTPYGWMEGSSASINSRIARARERDQIKQEKKERAEKIRREFGNAMADSILGDYDAMPLVIPEGEVVNGYTITAREKNWLSEDTYDTLIKIWLNGDGKRNGKGNGNFLDINEFMDYCWKGEGQFCSDWCKMDEFGESYGGFWRYPEGSVEYENAYNLSFRHNIYCLYKLPYPDRVLLKTVEWGCNSRAECVDFSNEICEWVLRKYNQLNPDGPKLPMKIPVIPEDFKVNIYE